MNVMNIFTTTIEPYTANIVARDYGVADEDAAVMIFEGMFDNRGFEDKEIGYYYYVASIPSIGCNMYYDFNGDYYFIMRK